MNDSSAVIDGGSPAHNGRGLDITVSQYENGASWVKVGEEIYITADKLTMAFAVGKDGDKKMMS